MPNGNPERTPSGQRVYRPTPGESRPTTMLSDEQIQQIIQHMHNTVGPVLPMAFHEIVSDDVHIDVHFIRPTKQRPFYTVFTTGMSALPMALPKPDPESTYAELLIHLPPGWPMDLDDPDLSSFKDEAVYWPIHWLKKMSRLPHEYRTFLAPWATVPNGDPARPFHSSTGLCCWLVLHPMLLEEKARRLRLPDRTIRFLNLIPLYQEEMDIKLNQGVDGLVHALEAARLSTEELAIIAPDRPNAALSQQPAQYLDDNSQASDPGRIKLSLSRLCRLEPDLTPPPPQPPAWMFWKKPAPLRMDESNRIECIERLAEHLAEGDSRAAIVYATTPLIVAAYSVDIDCVVLLRFPDWLVAEHHLEVGTRLLTVNTYRPGRHAIDIEPGPDDNEQWGNYHPLIADFLTDDTQRLRHAKARITEEEWSRCARLAKEYPKVRGRRARDGSPLRAHVPV